MSALADLVLPIVVGRRDGAKINIPDIVRALTPTQAGVVAAIERLIADGKLDAGTLRRPAKLNAEGPDLFARLIAEGKRRGMTANETSISIFGQGTVLYELRHHQPGRERIERCEAWLAASALEPSRDLVPRKGGGRPRKNQAPPETAVERESAVALPPPPAPKPLPESDHPSAAGLADEIAAFCAARGVPPGRFGRHAVGDAKLVERLRCANRCTPATAERVRALIAEAPRELFERAAPRPRAVPVPARRDPTTHQARQAQAARGVNRREAEKLLARDPDATHGRNGGITQAISEIRHQEATERRQTDPLERAKLALQRKGRVVHSAMLHGGRRDRFIVGGQRDPRSGRLKELTPAELIDLAEKVTGESFRQRRAG